MLQDARQRLRLALPAILLCALLAACGASPTATARPAATRNTAAAPSALAAAASVAPSQAAASGQTPGSAQNIMAPDPGRMIVKNGTLNLVVDNVDSSLAQIRDIARKRGGDLYGYTNSKSGEARVADVTIQVDVASFEAAMQDLRDLPGIRERKIDKAEAQDVTEEFADVTAQVTNLELTERQLRALLDKAMRTEDILAIQREITTVRGQIEKLQGRANFLDRRSALSTIAIHLETPPLPPSPTPAPTPAPDTSLSTTRAIEQSWATSWRLLHGAATAVLAVLVFFWWLVPLLAMGALARAVAARRAASAPPPPTPPASSAGD